MFRVDNLATFMRQLPRNSRSFMSSGPLGRPSSRWKDNIKMDLREVGWGHGLD